MIRLPPAPAGIGYAFAAYLTFVSAHRLYEVWRSMRNMPALAARGAVERGHRQLAAFILLHSVYPLMLAYEVFWGGARPFPDPWPWLAGLGFVLAHALRAWAVAALGPYWSIRVLVVPGMRRVRHGPYRFLRHPSYLAVTAELFLVPLAFGAWRTAALVTVANVILLGIRIRTEERALAWATSAQPVGAGAPGDPMGVDPADTFS